MHELILEMEKEREKLCQLAVSRLLGPGDRLGLLSEDVLDQSRRVDAMIGEIERRQGESEPGAP